jgi:hypothetical protein
VSEKREGEMGKTASVRKRKLLYFNHGRNLKKNLGANMYV